MEIKDKPIEDIPDYDKFKKLIEKKYEQKIVDYDTQQGYTILVLENGDEIRVDESNKLIGNPFGKRGARGSHFTKTKYSFFGYKTKGESDFVFPKRKPRYAPDDWVAK